MGNRNYKKNGKLISLTFRCAKDRAEFARLSTLDGKSIRFDVLSGLVGVVNGLVLPSKDDNERAIFTVHIPNELNDVVEKKAAESGLSKVDILLMAVRSINV